MDTALKCLAVQTNLHIQVIRGIQRFQMPDIGYSSKFFGRFDPGRMELRSAVRQQEKPENPSGEVTRTSRGTSTDPSAAKKTVLLAELGFAFFSSIIRTATGSANEKNNDRFNLQSHWKHLLF
jgi:hypothetical protein